METERTLTQRILAITMEIDENYPELSKYIAEMPNTIPDEAMPEVNKKKLQEYYDALILIVKKYKANHIVRR